MRLRFAHRSLALDGPPCMMGIVNVTPDSFYDRGLTATPAAAVARGLELAEAGAGIIDVGGMTAQPGRVLSEDEEIARVEPVVVGAARGSSTCPSRSTPTGRAWPMPRCGPAPTSSTTTPACPTRAWRRRSRGTAPAWS